MNITYKQLVAIMPQAEIEYLNDDLVIWVDDCRVYFNDDQFRPCDTIWWYPSEEDSLEERYLTIKELYGLPVAEVFVGDHGTNVYLRFE